jgi:hypothetical protein
LPTNFGEIASYNKRIAARFYLRSQIERNCGKFSEAEYHSQLAARYIQAANEQRIEMSRTPGRPVVFQRPRPWTFNSQPGPLAACWFAVQSLVGKLATAVRRSIARRKMPLQSLSLD